MALTRKFLAALGIEQDKIDEIITAHTETVDGLKDQLKTAQADAVKLAGVQAELDKLKQAAKNGGDYDKLKKEFDDYKTEVANKETAAAKKAALTELAKDAGLTEAGIAKAVKYADLSGLELDDSGKVKDAQKHIKALREEWPEHVITTTTTGAKTATPPANTGTGKRYQSKDEILSIKDAHERQVAIAQNLDMFGA